VKMGMHPTTYADEIDVQGMKVGLAEHNLTKSMVGNVGLRYH